MKKLILVHRWDSKPESDWYGSVANSLNEEFEVQIPKMPNTSEPEINAWVNKLKEIAPQPDKETHFIGHSMGCQTIMRYLEQLENKVKVGKIVFVAPWFNLQNLENKELERIAKPWIETPIDISKVRSHLTSLTAIFSDNDPFVSLSDKEIFKSLLDAKIIVEHNKGHFTQDDNVNEFPLVVNEVVTSE